MSDSRKNKTLGLLMCLVLLTSACGSSAQQESAISTAVAQTVQAGESLTEVVRREAAVPTFTPEASGEATLTPAITPTSAPTLLSAPPDPNCAKANLIGENPPDSAILAPGEYFWKTWTLQNSGTCAWNSSYQLIFWSGDLMGGLISYPLPDDVLPGEQTDISIYLKAPDTTGTFTGYWRLQTPWAANLGVGQYDNSFYVEVIVSDAKKPKYGITSVTYEVVRDPALECPKTVVYTVYATISTNGPYKFDYYWAQKDGNNSITKTLEFTAAGTITLNREWKLGPGVSMSDRWMMIVVTHPVRQEYDKAMILFDCE
jgi:hypothetical protein